MSYCRFSSEHWTSDVYVYESCRGFVIHVAEARHTSSEPYPVPPELLWERPPDEILYWLNKERDWLRAAVLTPIGLSRDGAVIETDTPAEAAKVLLDLRKEGYRVPATAIDELLAEGFLL